MAITGKANITQQITIAATGTGTLYFNNESTPYIGMQLAKLAGTTTTSFLNLYYSNLSPTEIPGAGGDYGSPITGSAYSFVWAGPDPVFSGTLFTASAAPASQFYTVGNLTARFVKVEVGSSTGGAFIVSMSRKGG